jgi:hypothetical protein
MSSSRNSLLLSHHGGSHHFPHGHSHGHRS